MISSAARVNAAQWMQLLEARLRSPDIDRSTTAALADLELRTAARLHEGEQAHRRRKPPLNPAEARALAERLAGLEWRAVQAEVGWGRWRGRRVYRVADVLVGWLRRPWRVDRLFAGLGSALKRRVLPELPEPRPAESFLAELQAQVSAVKPRPLPYPHLRVAHTGNLAMFGMVATYFDLATIDLDREMSTGFDMLLIEPGVDDPLDGLDATTLGRFREAGIPVLFVARTRTHLENPHISSADLILVENPELAEQAQTQGLQTLHIHPSVDDTIHNPIGWKQHPEHTLMVVADHPAITTDLQTLLPHADQITLYGANIPGLQPGQHHPERPVGTELSQHAKSHLAVYATPQTAATPTSHTQLVLDLTAAGAPVITPPDPNLTQLLDGHHLTATNTTELQTHLQNLQHPPTRERTSIPARLHIHTHHTRKHRFEQILTQLHIPTNPTPRISILLATKRPDHLEHAIANVTNQNWPNKELILILHGQNNFDLPHIQTLTQQLPYPTTLITCEETEIFGDILNKGLDQATGTYITKMDDDDHYGPNHLTDLHTAHTYSNADITGKMAAVVHLAEVDMTVNSEILDSERYHHHVAGPTMFGRRETWTGLRFLRRHRRIDTTLLERESKAGGVIFITHPYEFILQRRGTDHTWSVTGYQQFTKGAAEVHKGLPEVLLDLSPRSTTLHVEGVDMSPPEGSEHEPTAPAQALKREALVTLTDEMKGLSSSSVVDNPLAERLAGLEWRAVQAEVGWGRWRGRRVYRVADVLVGWLRRPWRVDRLFAGLGSALKRRVLPELPEPRPAESFLAELQAQVSAVKPRPLPYPHLRVAHTGNLAMFGMVATYFDLATIDLDREMSTGFDMLLIEPGVDDPLDGLDATTLGRFREAGIPVLFVARTRTHLENPHISSADLILVENPELAEQAQTQGLQTLHIHPSVDDTIHNPIGWKQHPEHTLMVVADHPAITTDLQTLLPHADQITLYGANIPGLQPGQHHPERPVGTELSQHAKSHLAVYATPQTAATPTSHTQLVLDLTAAGAPVITPPDPNLTQLLDGHHLTATNTTELQTHLQNLQHPPTRERTSIPARLHIHTHHTRKHRFEQILTQLHIPTNPTPRISILLATKRPDHLEHAIANVTNQNWPNKELILILHGQNNFDLPHIQTLTQQLPYPTTLITCEETEIFGDILNKGLDQATGTYITKMDDDDHYGPNHLTDLHTAHTYSNADITGKWGNIVYLVDSNVTLDYLTQQEEKFGSHVPGGTMFLQRGALATYRFARVNAAVESTLWKRMRPKGSTLYSTHRYNFIRVRHSDHTALRGDEVFLAKSTGDLRSGLDFERSML